MTNKPYSELNDTELKEILEKAEKNSIRIIVDRCLMIEHRRLGL